MKNCLKEGTYDGFGVSRAANGICFTFEADARSVCKIRLYTKRGNDKSSRGFIDVELPPEYCIGDVRSVIIEGLDEAAYDYNYVIDDVEQVDPYARRIVGRDKFSDFSRVEDDYQVRSAFDFTGFDWEKDKAPCVDDSQMVMYKLHVRGFTKDGGATGKVKGTFAGVMERIPYLKSLGVTTIELMPAYEFEELIVSKPKPCTVDFSGWSPAAITGYRLLEEKRQKEMAAVAPKMNYWGYGEGNYFAPKASYASGKNASVEFKELIKSLHRAGMECVMEMSFRQAMSARFIVDVLRYWVKEYHVDGFHLLGANELIHVIAEDAYLTKTKLFCETFPERLWSSEFSTRHLYQYNDDFLYAARKQVNNIQGNLVDFANQLKKQNEKIGFVNYFSNNNGFTLADVFSYNMKHNEANGEEDADGNDWNYSFNCGVEGVSRKTGVLQKRQRRMCLAMAGVFLGQGIPLLMAGDEFGNSQGGNNNAYCQDNKTGWVNWKMEQKNAWLTQYIKQLIAIRKSHSVLSCLQPYTMADASGIGMPDLSYYTTDDWSGELYPAMRAFGTAFAAERDGGLTILYIGWNFSKEEAALVLPLADRQLEWMPLLGEVCVSQNKMLLPMETVAVYEAKIVFEKRKKSDYGADHDTEQREQ
ncbi:MAG: alpha-amylase family glycosyl hydrolase [bacterium]|nr:alpha-amylase family glycosyl hydrolase [bacterium]